MYIIVTKEDGKYVVTSSAVLTRELLEEEGVIIDVVNKRMYQGEWEDFNGKTEDQQ